MKSERRSGSDPLFAVGMALFGFCVSACVTEKPAAAVESVAKVEQVKKDEKPEVKPVKIPPTNAKAGKVSGMGMDDFFPLQQTGAALIYDVRDPYFYQIDHIEGAINWSHKEYDAQVQKRDIEIKKAQDEGKILVVYCFNIACSEARNVAKKLSRRGYEVRVLTMGIDSWRDAGLPLVKGGGS